MILEEEVNCGSMEVFVRASVDSSSLLLHSLLLSRPVLACSKLLLIAAVIDSSLASPDVTFRSMDSVFSTEFSQKWRQQRNEQTST